MTRTLATGRRVLRQLQRDPRTVALLLAVPLLLMSLLRLVYDRHLAVFNVVECATASAVSPVHDVPRHIGRGPAGTHQRNALLASAFARTEFQVVQFFPATILPQLLLCGCSCRAGSSPRSCTPSPT